jgi:hypothetical protein
MARKKKGTKGRATSDWLERLYAVDPSAFVATRAALKTEAKEAGDTAAVAALGEARRPTASAWALNQVVRAHRDDVRTLLDAAEELRSAQQATLAGTPAGAEQLREAKREERRALFTLADAAEALLEERGTSRSPAMQRRISQTLRAAAYGPDEARERVLRGILDRDLEVEPGFGFGEAMALASGAAERPIRRTYPPPAPKTRTAPPPARTDRGASRREAREAEKAAERQAREMARVQKKEEAQRLRDMRRRETLRNQARRRQLGAEKEARRLAQRAGRLERTAEKSERTAEKARLAADAAWTAATEAAARADQARRAVAALEEHAILAS